jgi:CheY-like chemotaxis protein
MAKILVVDDDTRITKFLCEQLATKGHSCSFASCGKAALENVNKNLVDLLILDVMLPDVSGFEVCRRIRANTDLYTLPILFLSSMNSEEEISHGLAQGADDYVTKPFNTAGLLSRIENLLSTHVDAPMKDELTGLPTAKSIKLEIQKAINVRAGFIIGCIELMGISEFSQGAGHGEQAKALRHFGRCLHICAREVKAPFFSIGHMGGGHFVYIISPEKSKSYSDRVSYVWQRHLPKFLDSVGKPAQVKTWTANMTLEYLMCVTKREEESTASSRELFEILSHLRAKASATGQSGLFQDRRL